MQNTSTAEACRFVSCTTVSRPLALSTTIYGKVTIAAPSSERVSACAAAAAAISATEKAVAEVMVRTRRMLVSCSAVAASRSSRQGDDVATGSSAGGVQVEGRRRRGGTNVMEFLRHGDHACAIGQGDDPRLG